MKAPSSGEGARPPLLLGCNIRKLLHGPGEDPEGRTHPLGKRCLHRVKVDLTPVREGATIIMTQSTHALPKRPKPSIFQQLKKAAATTFGLWFVACLHFLRLCVVSLCSEWS